MRIKSIFATIITALSIMACAPTTPPTLAVNSPYFQSIDQIITISGVDIRYRDEGAKDAPAIVMIHGFTASLETWDAVAGALQNDYRVIRLDLPGHGLSGTDETGDYSNERTVQIVGAFIDKLTLDAPIIMGNSLGGLVAWRLAAANPERVSNLILIAPGGFSINGVTDSPVDVPAMVKYYLSKAPAAGVKQATTALYGDPSKLSPERLSQVTDMMQRPGNGDSFVVRAAQFTLPAPEVTLSRVTTPTLILWGSKDVMVPPDHGARFAAAMPNAALISYDGAGHLPHEEIPEKVSADIRGFLSPAPQTTP